MPSLPLSNLLRRTESSHLNGLRRYVTWILRIFVGGVFIFSGISKGVDPWGSIYIFEDYLSAMELQVPRTVMLLGAFALSSTEFLCGISLCLGCFRRVMPWVACLFMIVMLPLTLWIAITDPVADCGCFGEALIISNWATFWKNVVLTAAILWLIPYSRRIPALITPSLQWLQFVATGLYIVAISLYGYAYQPLLDFRPYPVGTAIMQDKDSGSSDNIRFIYEKNGEKHSFTIDEIPDEEDGWAFVDREQTSAATDSKDSFAIWSEDGNEEVTEDVIAASGKQFLILFPDLRSASIASSWQLNSIEAWAANKDIDVIAIAGNAGNQQLAEWKDLSMPSYPIYTADDTLLKEIARGNPSIVYLSDGKIMWKSSLQALDADGFLEESAKSDPMQFARDNNRILRNLSLLYISVIAVLILLSCIPTLKKAFGAGAKTGALEKSKINHGDMAPRQESSLPDTPAPQKTDAPSHD